MSKPSPSRRRWRPPISAALAVGFGALILAAVGSVYFFALDVATRNTSDLVQEMTRLSTHSIVARIDSHLMPAQAQATFLAERIADGTIDPADDATFLAYMGASLAATPQTFAIVYVREDGPSLNVIRTETGVAVQRVDDPPANVRKALVQARDARGPFWAELFHVAEIGEPVINVRVPVRRDGVFLGVMAAATRITALSDFLFELSDEMDAIAFVLYDRDKVLAHPLLTAGFPGLSPTQPLPLLAGFADPVLAAIWADGWEERREPELLGNGHLGTIANEPYAYIYEELNQFGDKPWLIGYYLRVANVSEPFLRLLRAAGFGAAVALVAMLAVLIVGRNMGRPIRRLAEAANAVRRLDLGQAERLPRSVFRETDDAAQAFNAMVDGLRWFETYVPKSLVERLLGQGKLGAIESELRSLTVMFTDIRGFTTMAESMSAAETAAFLNHHFDLVAACIEETGGTVDKYIGDAVMAFWGAPDPQADHAARACQAALAIRAAITRDNGNRHGAGAPSVPMRIGIHTGRAVVGNIGSRSRVNYTLVGDTVNIANRIEELAKTVADDDPVAILISGDTAAALPAGAFHLTSRGRHTLRGREVAVEVLSLDEDGRDQAST